LRFDLSAPILQDTAVELRRLVQETLPQIYPGARQVAVSLDLSGFDGLPELEPAYGFLIYRSCTGRSATPFGTPAPERHGRIRPSDGLLRVRVADDGKGFEPAAVDQFMKGGHYFFHDIAIRAAARWDVADRFPTGRRDDSGGGCARLTGRRARRAAG